MASLLEGTTLPQIDSSISSCFTEDRSIASLPAGTPKSIADRSLILRC